MDLPISKISNLKDYIRLTIPLCPDLDAYRERLTRIWSDQWFTNNGSQANELESTLARFLNIDRYTICSSGTTALQIALKTLEIEGEVIITPLSFPATLTPLLWQNLTPVFADVDDRLLIHPEEIERKITPKTRAIIAVHLFGNLCDFEAIQDIADRYQLKVIYDAAHAFGTEVKGQSITELGDATIHSFHATKLFHTAEGGGIAFTHKTFHETAARLRNFGFLNENQVELPGINGKMSELHAALGLEVMTMVDEEARKRRTLYARYCSRLQTNNLVEVLSPDCKDVRFSQFFAIKLADAGVTETVFQKLRAQKILARRYPLPILSNLGFTRSLPSASPDKLPRANELAPRIICLPFYGDLPGDTADHICDIVNSASK